MSKPPKNPELERKHSTMVDVTKLSQEERAKMAFQGVTATAGVDAFRGVTATAGVDAFRGVTASAGKPKKSTTRGR